MTARPRPFDLDALRHWLDVANAGERAPDRRHAPPLAALLGCQRRHAHRILALGALTEDEADRAACALGRHPAELWPEWHALAEPTDPDRGPDTREENPKCRS